MDITIPVYNEEHDLAPAVRRLHNYLNSDFPFSAQITIADNGSTDGNAAQALRLAAELRRVRLIRLSEKGRGRALAESWLTSDVGGPALCRRDGRRSHDLRPDRAEFLISCG